MQQHRKDFRVDVDLPIQCSFISSEQEALLLSQGSIQDISLGGMKISVPLNSRTIAKQARSIDYEIQLPEPFQVLNGQGDIKWTFQDPNKNHLQIGLSFSNMDRNHQEEIACIVEELVECISG